MEVGSRGPPGATDLGDRLPLLDFLAYTGQKGRAMSVECGISVAVVDDDCLTVAGDPSRVYHYPRFRSLDSLSRGDSDVDYDLNR